MECYILDENKKPVLADIQCWGKWFQESDRHVEKTVIGDVMVSTVFLGIDHGFGQHGRPVLFETMIFGGEHGGYQERYCTWDEAVKGHAEAVRMVNGALDA